MKRVLVLALCGMGATLTKLRIEILAEDRSGIPVVSHLVQQVTKAHYPKEFELASHPHNGKGRIKEQVDPRRAWGLLDLLPAKLRAYEKAYAGENLLLIIICDQDQDEISKLFASIQKTIGENTSLPSIIAICEEEIEAWLLGDKEALKLAYPNLDEKAFLDFRRSQKKGTWEILASIIDAPRARYLKDLGFSVLGKQKYDWAVKISPFLNFTQNQAPCFLHFYRRYTRLLGKINETS